MTVQTFRFDHLSTVPHGISTRHGGVSPAPFASLNMSVSTGDAVDNVVSNRRSFFQAIDVPPERVYPGRLSHGSDVTEFRPNEASAAERDPLQPAFDSDAVVSNVPGHYFTMTFADCVPLILFDPTTRSVGAIHAGWRGTAADIAAKTVVAMRRAYNSDPRDLLVGIGPSIGACCFEVKRDVAAAFRVREAVQERQGRLFLDLWECNRRQLIKAGARPENIVVSGICTSCAVADFYSHRAERGRTGRFALCVGLP